MNVKKHTFRRAGGAGNMTATMARRALRAAGLTMKWAKAHTKAGTAKGFRALDAAGVFIGLGCR